ncbi:hypothetical protein [Paraburkholderia diazotrophica]|uniref:Uncharacterized protein n=1 Tax=Paraburkholderia diazotrophica TaxID=667676 RepID=A0A1H7BCI3_9BURK|nr:hypothetical protein [Paraburkholderia diazotrophica]SEJ73987.1 hypothetical protein SAMN05192539_10175 [Paraburkholderia diazotrophica]
MRFEEFDTRLSRLLVTMPAGTIADLTDGMIAWWNGTRTIYAWIGSGDDDRRGGLHARELDLADDWGQFHDWLAAWINEPRFSARPDADDHGR